MSCEACVCGHAKDDHGGDVAYPGSTACRDDDCDCIAFESDGEDAPGAVGK